MGDPVFVTYFLSVSEITDLRQQRDDNAT